MTQPLPYEVVHELGVMHAEDREWQRAAQRQEIAVGPSQLPIELWGPDLVPIVDFTVEGDPVGQGRISFHGKGRPAFHSNRHILDPWRAEIGRAFARLLVQMSGDGLGGSWVALSGALVVNRYYTVQKPATKKSQRPWPIVTSAKNSDIDHYDRAVFDSLKMCGAIEDDALIIGGHHWKAYPGTYPLCPPTPGVRIQIFTVGVPS